MASIKKKLKPGGTRGAGLVIKGIGPTNMPQIGPVAGQNVGKTAMDKVKNKFTQALRKKKK